MDYPLTHLFDEMLGTEGEPRPEYRRVHRLLSGLTRAEMAQRHDLAQRSFRNHGVTFTVYQDDTGIEKIFPFDLVPRIITARTWQRLEAGLAQRMRALNLFLEDVYGGRRILFDGATTSDGNVKRSENFRACLHATISSTTSITGMVIKCQWSAPASANGVGRRKSIQTQRRSLPVGRENSVTCVRSP